MYKLGARGMPVMHKHEHFREWYAKVKPIRGTEIRPISHQRNKHKQVVQLYMGDGNYAYAAKLYDTECVTYYPDDTFSVNTDGFHSTTTKDFITSYTPPGVYCVLMKNVTWLCGPALGDKKYPLSKKPIKFHYTKSPQSPGGWIEPVEPVVVTRNMVNRSTAKQIRNRIKPFMDWTRAMLAMSDGWIRHDTVVQFFPLSEDKSRYTYMPPANSPEALPFAEKNQNILTMRHYYPSVWKQGENAENLLSFFSNLHEDDYAYGMCMLLRMTRHLIPDIELATAARHEVTTTPQTSGVPFTYSQTYHDVRVKHEKLRECMDKLIRALAREAVQVEASDKVMDNVI